GLLQLIAYGVQDIYLTGDPQITYFKSVYRRYTNFAVQLIREQLIGNPGFGKKLSVNIPKIGDLINKIYLNVVLDCVNPNNANFAWIRRIGHALIKEITIEIG